MKIEEIRNIIINGENICAEFKISMNKLPSNLFETVCAFLNTKGGVILLGVDDNGNILGIEKENVN
ncbi:MAG: ATP-binding protein, partial [Chlorobi bacterium]|nr:ATP-binding protein [Chlorobiota bacterium]